MISKSLIAFKLMLKQITRELMLFVVCLAPILAGIVFKLVIPRVEILLCNKFNKVVILEPYYYLFDWLLVLLPGTMFAFVGALVALGEIDDKIAGYMSVTPAGTKGYLLSRLGYPSFIAFCTGIFLLKIFGLTVMDHAQLVILCFSSALMGVDTALLVISVSTNKVEGMAMGKLSGFILLGMFVPCFLHSPMQYVASLLPSFWIGKYMLSNNAVYLVPAVAIFVIWTVELYKKYEKKVLL